MKEQMVLIRMEDDENWQNKVGWLQDQIKDTEYYNVRPDGTLILLALKTTEFFKLSLEPADYILEGVDKKREEEKKNLKIDLGNLKQTYFSVLYNYPISGTGIEAAWATLRNSLLDELDKYYTLIDYRKGG